MRLTTSSILVITFILYMGQMENARVLATAPPIDPATAIEAINTGVELSERVMNTLKEAIESSTIMKKINAEIKKIKLVNDYLSENEKQMVTDAKIQLALAENEFTIMRIELTEMAELTKKTTTRLIKFTNRLSDDSSPKFNRQFKVIFKRFMTLMTVTSTKLKEAKGRYDTMSTKLAETKGKLGAFKDRVDNLDDEHSKRYNEYADRLRAEAYGGSAGCVVFAPSCVFVYPVVAAIVETKLKEYKNQVQTLKKNCKSVFESVTGMLKQITAKDKELEEELELIIKWENLVLAAKENYGSTPITETIQDILDLKKLAIEEFQDLYNAANAFNEWILTRN